MTTDAPKKTREGQPKLPGMKSSPLEKAAEAFIEIKQEQAELKIELETIGDQVLTEMKKENRHKYVISTGGENYSFEIVKGEESLSCKKETRTPKKKEGSED